MIKKVGKDHVYQISVLLIQRDEKEEGIKMSEEMPPAAGFVTELGCHHKHEQTDAQVESEKTKPVGEIGVKE
jgi:hypothetical protein